MFSLSVCDTDWFLDLPLSTQAVYFHLNLRADDDGFVNNHKSILRKIGANANDYQLLVAKRFVIEFESGVIVIKHWRMHNTIQKDRYKPTQFKEEFDTLSLKENKAYTDAKPPVSKMDTDCIQSVSVDIDIDIDKGLGLDLDNNTLLIHSNNINYEELARELVNLWNSLKFEKKEELTDSNYNVLVKACKHFGVDNVVSAIQNYEKVLFSDYYFSHVWNLKDFLLSAKGLPNFLPEGETWKAYKKNHKGSILDGVKPAPKPKGESNPVVKGFLDSIV